MSQQAVRKNVETVPDNTCMGCGMEMAQGDQLCRHCREEALRRDDSMQRSRPMSLERFKEQLESDAQRRCEQQEKTIKDLHRSLQQSKEEAAQKDKQIEHLQNRCYAMTRGTFCLICGYNRDCKRWKKTNAGLEKAEGTGR